MRLSSGAETTQVEGDTTEDIEEAQPVECTGLLIGTASHLSEVPSGTTDILLRSGL